MVLISNKGSFYNLTRCLFYCFVYSYKIYNKVLITKAALTKLLEDTLGESLKNMSNERLGCQAKSLLSQNFDWTMSALLKTLVSHLQVNRKVQLFDIYFDMFKTLIPAFVSVFTATAKNCFLQGRLDTILCLHPILIFSFCFLISKDPKSLVVQ